MDWLQPIEHNLSSVGINLDVGWRPQLLNTREGPVRVTRGGTSQAYVLKYSRDAAAATPSSGAAWDSPLLLASDHITASKSEALRRAGIQHLDASGNMFMYFGDVYIDIRGRRGDKRPDAPSRGTNLFSAQRARVVMALLAWPRLASDNMRETSKAAGVALGTAHTALNLMETAGYLQSSKRLIRRRELLQQWAAAYPTNLGPSLSLAAFHGDPLDIKKAAPEDPVFISGESALPTLIRPTTATLYVKTYNPRMGVINRWRADAQPNIFVRRKFWTSPESHDVPMVGFQTAPWPLIYADLLTSGEPRQLEVAKTWVENHVGLDDL